MLIAAAVWTFIRKQWKLILLLALALYLMQVGYNWIYQRGFNDSDSIWIKANNEQVKDLNEKIARLEADSKKEASKLRDENVELNERLTILVNAGPKIVLRDVQGKKLTCDGKEVVPYLGQDFADVWNTLNEEGAMK